MRTPCPLFVELCAGTAAVSLRLAHPMAKPPVSRMGAKTGYSNAILNALGLAAGQGAEHYLWCEPDAGVRLLLEAYRDHALALDAAAVIRGWRDEEPRALWERLRAEGPARHECDAREVARWALVQGWTMRPRGSFRHPYGGFSASGSASATGCDGLTIDGASSRLTSLPTLEATIHPDARTVDPREVARWAYLHQGSYQYRGVEAGIGRPQGKPDGGGFGAVAPLTEMLPRTFPALPTLEATIHPDARTLNPPTLPDGTVAYMDPPYQGTTGYADALPRDEVLALAHRWSAAGAIVAISEAVPLAEGLGEGWEAIEITAARKGQKRTFSKQQREWLTINRPPAVRFDGQRSLW